MRWILTALLLLTTPAYAGVDYWLYDQTDQKVIAKNSPDTRPIASLTKIMTAMVYLDTGPDLGQYLKLSSSVRGYLPRNHYTAEELLTALLVWSDNSAAETLAENYPGGRTAFINAMNAKARYLNLLNTNFDDPSGLSASNVSTANEVAEMLIASQKYSVIQTFSVKKQAEVNFHNKKHSKLQRVNTNVQALTQINDIIVSKTGFTNPAGFCMGVVINHGHKIYVLVVLGAKNKFDRLKVAKALVEKNILTKV